MKLTEQEKNSLLWKKLKEHITARIERHRAANDASLSHEQTEHMRGRIAELKDLLGLEKEPVKINE